MDSESALPTFVSLINAWKGVSAWLDQRPPRNRILSRISQFAAITGAGWGIWAFLTPGTPVEHFAFREAAEAAAAVNNFFAPKHFMTLADNIDGSVSIVLDGISGTVRRGCEGVNELSMLVAALMVAPFSRRRRLMSIAVGGCLMYGANTLRLISLSYAQGTPYFSPLHEYFLPFGVLVPTLAYASYTYAHEDGAKHPLWASMGTKFAACAVVLGWLSVKLQRGIVESLLPLFKTYMNTVAHDFMKIPYFTEKLIYISCRGQGYIEQGFSLSGLHDIVRGYPAPYVGFVRGHSSALASNVLTPYAITAALLLALPLNARQRVVALAIFSPLMCGLALNDVPLILQSYTQIVEINNLSALAESRQKSYEEIFMLTQPNATRIPDFGRAVRFDPLRNWGAFMDEGSGRYILAVAAALIAAGAASRTFRNPLSQP